MKSMILGLAGAMVAGMAATAPSGVSAASPISSITMADSMRQSAGLETIQVRDGWRGGGGWGHGGWGHGGGWGRGGWGGGGWGGGGWRHQGWGHRGWGPGPAIGLGLGLGLGAAALATAPLYGGYGGNYYAYQSPTYAYGGLQPWSPAWYRYCSGRYRSFDPSSGYFLSHSGQRKFCRG